MSRADLQTALAHKMGFPLVDLERFPLDPQALALLPRRLAISHRVLPLLLDQERLIVAVDRPGRVLKLRQLDAYAQMPIVPVLALKSQILVALNRQSRRRLEPERVGARELLRHHDLSVAQAGLESGACGGPADTAGQRAHVDRRPLPDALPSRRLMPALFIGVFMAALDTAVIAPALPALREAFAIDHREAALLMVVFILCSLCSTALLANLGDRHGRRPVFLGSVACFAAGSLLIALSPSFWMVLVGRAVQGVGAGGITPTASAMIGDAVAAHERGRALGLIGATYGMAFVLGPPLATLLMLAFSWHWIFLINLPIAALVLAWAHAASSQRSPRSCRRWTCRHRA